VQPMSGKANIISLVEVKKRRKSQRIKQRIFSPHVIIMTPLVFLWLFVLTLLYLFSAHFPEMYH
jgi:cell division septal protein FtsQ